MIQREDLSQRLLKAEYAVRGPIVLRAQELQEQGRQITYCNIGNPQALRQSPLTFIRQILSLLEYPELLDDDRFPSDIRDRVRLILEGYPDGVGAYSQSTGIPLIREAVASFIEARDQIPSSRDQVILTDGASKGVQAVLLALLKDPRDAFMIPIPQYPLYSASLTLFGGEQVGYHLDEDQNWQLSERALDASIDKARKEGNNPVCIVVINPGNPTGGVLSLENIQMIIRFAKRNRLSILADEVYQENVYDPGAQFHSFARVMHEMGEHEISLFSVHSASKGFLGECGHRAGYLECRNVPEAVMAEFVKLQSISLCANLPGQFTTYAMVAPPREGEASFDQYVRERDAILGSLSKKASILHAGINRIPGLSVGIPQGAMYAFVRLELPGPGRAAASDATTLAEREFDYCLKLLEETGICVVPGSGFGQPPGTLHFRTTFLPPEEEMESLVERLKSFHESYTREPVH